MHCLTRVRYYLKQISVGDGIDIRDIAGDVSDCLMV